MYSEDTNKKNPMMGEALRAEAPSTRRDTLAGEIESLNRNQCARSSMRDSIIGQLSRAQSSAYQAERLHRLVYLADKNPEVMEMIELVRDLNLM